MAQRSLPVKVGTGGLVLGVLSESSGWIVIDAVVGGGVGWLIAPKGQEAGYALGGAAATGLGGVLGLLGLLGWRYLLAPAIEGKGFAPSARDNPIARDYVAVTHRGKAVAGPFRHYDEAKREADRVGGYVKFAAEAKRRRRR